MGICECTLCLSELGTRFYISYRYVLLFATGLSYQVCYILLCTSIFNRFHWPVPRKDVQEIMARNVFYKVQDPPFQGSSGSSTREVPFQLSDQEHMYIEKLYADLAH